MNFVRLTGPKCLLAVFLLTTASCIAGTPAKAQRDADYHHAKALKDETIPVLDLQQASFEEGFSAVRHEWDQRHPREPFPIKLTDFSSSNPDIAFWVPKITLHLENTAYFTALRYLAVLSRKQIVTHGGLFDYAEKWGVLENAAMRTYDISPTTLARLKLRPDASPRQVRAAWSRLGIQTPEWTSFKLKSEGRQLSALCTEPNQEKIFAILTLFDAGYNVSP